jgi:hypothetical protein
MDRLCANRLCARRASYREAEAEDRRGTGAARKSRQDRGRAARERATVLLVGESAREFRDDSRASGTIRNGLPHREARPL